MIDDADPKSLRYRRANDRSDELGQVFTPAQIASLLISGLPATCKRLLDLGAGKAALSSVAFQTLEFESSIMIERDPKYANWLKRNCSENNQVIQTNVLDTEWEASWNPSRASDAIISNPPYGMIALTPSQLTELRLSDLSPPLHGKWVRGDAAFLARAWQLTTTGSALAFIVTAPIVSGREYHSFREKLVRELRDLTITQLDERSFPSAEVRAFLVNGVRAPIRRRNVVLRKADSLGQIVDELRIDHASAIARLDIDFHRASARLGLSRGPHSATLADVGTHIARGSLSHNEFEKLGIGAFHTTDFARNGEDISLIKGVGNYRCASTGDILIPRVGSRCLTRHARVVLGEGLYTDCVFRLRVPAHAQERVWHTMASNFGCEWREAHASGNCARHLTQATLLSMPLL